MPKFGGLRGACRCGGTGRAPAIRGLRVETGRVWASRPQRLSNKPRGPLARQKHHGTAVAVSGWRWRRARRSRRVVGSLAIRCGEALRAAPFRCAAPASLGVAWLIREHGKLDPLPPTFRHVCDAYPSVSAAAAGWPSSDLSSALSVQ